MTNYSLNVPFSSSRPLENVKVHIEYDEENKKTTIIIEDADIDTNTIIISECNPRMKKCKVRTVVS